MSKPINNTYGMPVRVYIEDTDAGGIVYYVNYLKFFERARTEMIRSLGFGKTSIWESRIFVVHSLNIDYKRSAVLDDELWVTAEVIKQGRAGMTFSQTIIRNNDILCTAQVKIACVDKQTGKPAAIPQDLLSKLKEI